MTKYGPYDLSDPAKGLGPQSSARLARQPAPEAASAQGVLRAAQATVDFLHWIATSGIPPSAAAASHHEELAMEVALAIAGAAPPATSEERRDAARYRWLRATLERSVGGGVEVNDERLVYQQPEPGEEVRVFWYPDTPVGFYQCHGATLDAAIDAAMAATREGGA